MSELDPISISSFPIQYNMVHIQIILVIAVLCAMDCNQIIFTVNTIDTAWIPSSTKLMGSLQKYYRNEKLKLMIRLLFSINSSKSDIIFVLTFC